MNKEFIPYEQALELKELGFDEPCLFAFDNCSTPIRCTDLRTSEQKFNGVNYNSSTYTSQPTFSQAFRWFREKYSIQGYIYSSTVRGNKEGTKQFTGYIWNINRIDMPFISTDARDELHDTYEEAELACLKKLIEIVERKPEAYS